MTATLRLPSTAPFAAEQIELLNRALSGSDSVQRTWLSGFLAGLEAATTEHPANTVVPAAAPRGAMPLLVAYATDSGNAEGLAHDAKKTAARRGFAPRVVDMADITVADAAAASSLLVIASTWGEGDPPERAVDFYEALMAEDAPSFAGVSFGVLALGDRAYVNFCETGRRMDERLEALGGVRAVDRVDCDLDYETPAAEWLDRALAALEPEETDGQDGTVVHLAFPEAPRETVHATKSSPFAAEITELTNLNGSRSDKATWHVELALGGSGLSYEPGDAIGIVPENDPSEVDAVLAAARLDGDDELRSLLAERFEITRLTSPVVQGYADLVDDPELRAIADDPQALTTFMADRHLADLLAEHPASLDRDRLISLLRPLPPRLYSVASSTKVVPGEAHLLVGRVRYEMRRRVRRGVASSLVGERRTVGDRLRIYHKPNRHFRLPADGDAPIVMIGAGTGIAPYRAFVQEREATGASGTSWLFFGERRYTHDFLYQLDWQDALKSGALTRLDVAFSRDQPEKVYVQDRLWERRADLHASIEDGAHIYVCGDEKHMAKDVHAMLARILAERRGIDAEAAEAELAALRRQGRYQRDVY